MLWQPPLWSLQTGATSSKSVSLQPARNMRVAESAVWWCACQAPVHAPGEDDEGPSHGQRLASWSLLSSARAQAWCEHHQLPQEEAAFLLEQRVLKPEDGKLK